METEYAGTAPKYGGTTMKKWREEKERKLRYFDGWLGEDDPYRSHKAARADEAKETRAKKHKEQQRKVSAQFRAARLMRQWEEGRS